MFGNLFKSKGSSTGEAPSQAGLDTTKKTTSLNLLKERTDLVTNLVTRKGILTKFRVAFNFDFSGSMSHLYSSGKVQELFERLFPIAITFDDNAAVDLLAFHNSAMDLGEVTMGNYMTCIQDMLIKKHSMGTTSYAPFIKMIVNKYKKVPGDPVYVICIVDGDCDDKSAARKEIIEASKYGIFFQFIGIGDASMDFLEELDTMDGRTVDNANFFRIKNLSQETDKGLYAKLLAEVPLWITEAKNKGII